MNTLLRYYVYGHWHISICALILYCGSALFFVGSIDASLAIHVTAATMLVYTCHRLFSQTKMNLEGQHRYSFANEKSTTMVLLIALSLPVSIFTFFCLERAIQVALIISGIISMGYILPLIFRQRLRDIGVSKIILISMVWAILPVLNVLSDMDSKLIALIFSEHFFFIFALTLPFDVRDQELDQKAQVSNLANTLGLPKLKSLLIFCVVLSVTSACILFYLDYYSLVLISFTLVFLIIQLAVTISLKKTKSELYYLFFLDSFILFKGLIYWLCAL